MNGVGGYGGNLSGTGMLRDLLDLSHIPRWTTHPMTRPQSVAEHSYRVAVISMNLFLRWTVQAAITATPDILADVLRWALVHDGPEVKTGDIPAPVKRYLPPETWLKLESSACPWYSRECPPPGRLVSTLVHCADLIESITWVSRYGQAFRDRFDDEKIEQKLRYRLQRELEDLDSKFPGLKSAVEDIVREVCP